jgi:hypothetical protein
MKRMAVSNVLVVGMKGLGVEIGKSAGPANVTTPAFTDETALPL